VPVSFRRLTPESIVAAFTVASAGLMAAGYLVDAAGLAMSPVFLALVAAAGGVGAFLVFRESACPERATASRGAHTPPGDRGTLILFTAVVLAAFGYLLWLASPSLLPVTNGPDIVHHLLLIHLIQRTHHLVHDPALSPYLLEMMNYTPGSHIMAAAVADWLRVDALRALLPVTAAFVAMKVGIVYALAVRIIGPRPHAAVLALAAPILLLVPSAYVLGSFFQFFFFAQVVSETFALALVLAIVNWTREGRPREVWLAAAGAVGVFLSWPVWLGPALAAAAIAIACASLPVRARALAAAIVIAPMAVVAILHTSTHAAGAAIIGSSGAVTRPSFANIGVGFAALGAIGLVLGVRVAAARPVAVLFVAVMMQGLALGALDWRAGSTSFYMPLKMVYLAVLPCAVLGALALAVASATISSRVPRAHRVAALVPLVLAVLLARGRFPLKRQHGPISEPSLAAGTWARGAIPPGCVDYFSRHWLTGYWLHLDVLGNPRLSDRMRAETFEMNDTVGKWIEGRGLPYAIVEDLAAVPRDARSDMITLQTFGPAAVVKNARPGGAPGADAESLQCRVR
jgi:hypothetical protein